MNDVDKQRLTDNRVKLVGDICFCDIKYFLQQEKILSIEDVEEIETSGVLKEQMRKFLDLLVFRGPEAYSKFYQSLGENYEWVQEYLDEETSTEAARVYTHSRMNDVDKQRLTDNRVKLVGNIRFCDIKDFLQQEKILSIEDVEEIETSGVLKEQMRKFLDLLVFRGPDAYSKFYQSLGEKYNWIQECLGKETSTEAATADIDVTVQTPDRPRVIGTGNFVGGNNCVQDVKMTF
ncbi:hypothetical protein ScPMuIL_004371 [Solemya velum]